MRVATRMLAIVVAGLISSACGGGGGGGGGGSKDWTKATVMSDATVRSIAIALDSGERPHVAFIDTRTSQVFYASLSGGTWSAAAVPGTSCADEEIDLALDAQDNPHLAYQCDNGVAPGGVRYAYRDGAGWHVEVVDSVPVGARNPSLSLALSSTGAPAISFYAGDGTYHGIRYATRAGGTWAAVTPDPATYAGFHGTSLAFDASDHPVLAYFTYDYTVANQALRLARFDGASWTAEVVDSGEGVGEWSSLALDSSGRPHLAYLDTLNGTVKYATKATTWTKEVVGSGYVTSLALAPDGTPWVAFGVAPMSWVKVAPRAAGSWPADTVPAASSFWTLGLAVDAAGARHVAFDDAGATYAMRP